VTAIASEEVGSLEMRLELKLVDRGPVVIGTDGRSDLLSHELVGPGAYAFTCRHGDGRTVGYVGESENLHDRMTKYQAAVPGTANKTNAKVHKEIVDCVASGGTCDLDVAFDVAVNNEVLPLDRGSARKLAENALLVHLRRQGIVCLNVDDLILEDTD